MVNFPNSLDTWSDVTDDIDIVDDSHMNDAHNSLIAIENVLNLLSTTIASWKVEQDYIEGLEALTISATQINISPGTVAIDGKLIYISGTSSVIMPTNLRSGESEQADDFYNIYAYISGTLPVFKLSNINPNSDFSHPNETGWRAITGVPNIAGDFETIDQYGDFIDMPLTLLYGQAPTGGYDAINMLNFIPQWSKEVRLIVVGTATATGEIFLAMGAKGISTAMQNQMRLTGQVEDVAMTQTFNLTLSSTLIYLIGYVAKYGGVYLSGVKLQRRRS